MSTNKHTALYRIRTPDLSRYEYGDTIKELQDRWFEGFNPAQLNPDYIRPNKKRHNIPIEIEKAIEEAGNFMKLKKLSNPTTKTIIEHFGDTTIETSTTAYSTFDLMPAWAQWVFTLFCGSFFVLTFVLFILHIKGVL